MILQHRNLFPIGANGSSWRSVAPHTDGTRGSRVLLQKSIKLFFLTTPGLIFFLFFPVVIIRCMKFPKKIYLSDAVLTGIRGISNCSLSR